MKHKPMYLHRSADGTPARIKHDYDAKFRATPAYRQRIAEAMAAGIRDYVTIVGSLQPKPAAASAPGSPRFPSG